MSYSNYVTRDELNDAVTDLYNDIESLKADIDDGSAIGEGAIKACHIADSDREFSFRVKQTNYKQGDTARTLRDSLKSAEHSAARWQTRAESAEARVEELTTENARLEQEVAEVTEDYKAAVDSAGVAHGELRAHEGYIQWLEGQVQVRDHNIDHQKDRIRELTEERDGLRTAVPRVIRPDEVRFGQKIVFSNHNNENDWIVEVVDWETRFASDYNGTILLLRNTPEDADEDERRGEVIDPADVREGDVLDVWAEDGYRIFTATVAYDGIIEHMPSDEIRLVSRPADSDDFPRCRIKQTGICEDVG